MNYWFCSRCERPMRSLTNPDRWLRLCATCDTRPAETRRSYALRWFDERYPPPRTTTPSTAAQVRPRTHRRT